MATALNVQVRYIPEIIVGANGGFTAVCNEFGLAASGDSANDARVRLRAIVESFCAALQRHGRLDEAIKKTGIRSEYMDRQQEEDVISVAA